MQPTDKQLESIIEDCADLQKAVLRKHTKALLEELAAIIIKKNKKIAHLRKELSKAGNEK